MNNNEKDPKRGRECALLLLAAAIFVLTATGLVGCSQSTEEPEAVDYTPLAEDGWEVSTPAEQGLDPTLVAELQRFAGLRPTAQVDSRKEP